MILCALVSIFSAVLTLLFTVDVEELRSQKQKTSSKAIRVSSEAHLIDLQDYETDEEEVNAFTRNLTTAISMPNFLDLE